MTTKADLVKAVAEAERVAPTLVTRIIDALVENVTEELVKGEEVKFSKFGKLETRIQAASCRINPQTRKPIEVPEKTTVVFRPSPSLKQRLNP